jgi:carboxymethylenebutenolidase
MKMIEIATPDGVAPTYVWDNAGPTVLFLIDGLGMRAAIRDVGAHIAAQGYRVVMPDLFYRLGAYEAHDPKVLFANAEVRRAWWSRILPIATREHLHRDLGAYLDYLAVPKCGVVGYCMGGRLAITAAGQFPERIAAAAAYHPGDLVTDKPDSPHLLAPKIKARLYIGAAMKDASFDDAAQATLADALTKAHVDYQLEMYQAMHGWVPSDTPVHDPVATAKHYETMFALFASTLS